MRHESKLRQQIHLSTFIVLIIELGGLMPFNIALFYSWGIALFAEKPRNST
jgi:hypothetical protein